MTDNWLLWVLVSGLLVIGACLIAIGVVGT